VPRFARSARQSKPPSTEPGWWRPGAPAPDRLPAAQWAYFLPTFGLFLTIVGLLCLKFSRLRIPAGAGPAWE
jgi:hypothetical protein